MFYTILTVIIPVYNTEKYLQRCFESLVPLLENLAIEVIFVNDGSTDNSLEVIHKFQSQYDFVKLINQQNQGLSAARNSGIKEASGSYFILLDSDDWLNWNEIEKIYKLAIVNQAELVGFQLQFVDENFTIGKTANKQLVPYNKIISGENALITGFQPSSACLFMYNTAFVKENKLEFFKGIMQEDVEFTIRLLIPAKRVYFTETVGYNYYRRTDSMTTTLSKERIERYLSDSIIVAEQIRKNTDKIANDSQEEQLILAIQKNYNSVVWNLLWRFLAKPKEVSYVFKIQCLNDLKLKSLYPIKGDLKTSFQHKTKMVFNLETIFKLILKIRS